MNGGSDICLVVCEVKCKGEKFPARPFLQLFLPPSTAAHSPPNLKVAPEVAGVVGGLQGRVPVSFRHVVVGHHGPDARPLAQLLGLGVDEVHRGRPEGLDGRRALGFNIEKGCVMMEF